MEKSQFNNITKPGCCFFCFLFFIENIIKLVSLCIWLSLPNTKVATCPASGYCCAVYLILLNHCMKNHRRHRIHLFTSGNDCEK